MIRRGRFSMACLFQNLLRTAIYLVNLFTQKYVFFNRKLGNYCQWKRKPDLYIFSLVFAWPFLKQQAQELNALAGLY
jgi:hypothetical protein